MNQDNSNDVENENNGLFAPKYFGSQELSLFLGTNIPGTFALQNFHHHHHLFAQYAEMNSKICNVPERKANSFSSNNCL